MKSCRQCLLLKPIEEFFRMRVSKDGRQPYCKSCSKAKTYQYRIDNPEVIKKIDTRKYKKHNTKIREKARDAYAADPQKFRERARRRDRSSPKYKQWKREYYLKNKEKIDAKNRLWQAENKLRVKDRSLQRNYGLTLAQFEQMKIDQNNQCLICRIDCKLVIDHCHSTGTIRGLLCEHCNFLLGNAKDNESILSSAITYLLKAKNGT